MARGRRGSGARGNRGRSKSTTSSKGKSSSSSSSGGGGKSGGSKNSRGSGARGNRGRTTSTKTTSTKSTSTKSTSTKSKSVSSKTKQGKTRTPAQMAAASRIAQGKTISQVKSANTAAMKAAAARRNEAFQAKRKGGTSAQVARDNAMYGNTFPAGGLTISDAGRAQAEANRKEATRKRTFDPGRLPLPGGVFNPLNAFTPEGRATMLAGYADAAVDTINFGKNVLTAGYAKDKFNVPKLPSYKDAGQQFLRNVSSVALPLAQGKANLGRFRSVDPISGKAGFANEIAKMTTSNAAFKAGKVPQLTKTGITNVNPFTFAKAFTPQMVATGPTAGATIALNTAMTGATIGDKAKSGGLNIGSAAQAGEGGEATSNTGRTVVTTDRDKNISYDGLGIAKDVALGSLDALTGNRFDFDNLGRPGDDKTFTQKFETFKKSPLQQAIISKQTGIDAKRIINEGEDAAKSLFSNYIGDIDASSKKGIRNPIARFLKDVGSDDATAMAGRAIDAFRKDDENFSNDPNALTKALKFTGLPQLSEENVQDIRHTFNKSITEPTGIEGKSILKNVPYNQAFGLANRIVSGKLSDATGEAMNQLGMGNVGGIDDAVNLGMQINTNKQTEGTVANQRFGELNNLIQKYGPGKGQIPTIPSIIKGIGGAVNRTGASGNTMQIQGGNNMTATLPMNQEVAQLLPLPTTATQTGTNSGNLANMMQNAYASQMSLYGMNPNYFANIMQPRFNTRPRKFRQVFNRGYF